MASQIYSRYIPPKKAVPVNHQKPQKLLDIETAPSSPPINPSIKPSASSSYSRYIPAPKAKSPETTNNESPKRKREIEPELEGPKKAKKLKKDKATASPVPELERENGVEVEKPRKKQKKRSKDAHVTEDDTPMEDDPKHKKMLEKREKSLRKAEKRAVKDAKRAAKEGGNTEEITPEEPQELHDLVPLPQPEPIPELPLQSSISSLPPWLASPIRVSPADTADFRDLGLQEEAVHVLHSKGFMEAFAVQAAILPLLLPGKSQTSGDILVSAATGSGKTLSYVLPMIENVSRNRVTKLRALIVLPTRELVAQAKEVCEVCSSAFSNGDRKRVKIGTAVGNEAFKVEQRMIMEQEDRYDPAARKAQEARLNRKWESSDWESCSDDDDILCDDEPISRLLDHIIAYISQIDILICTPGRLVEHLKSTPGFTLENINWLVVDEADKLLDQMYQNWLDIVISQIPQRSRNIDQHRLRKIILSATMTRNVGNLAELKLHRPKLVVLEGSKSSQTLSHNEGHILPGALVESAIPINEEELKPLYLQHLLVQEEMVSCYSSTDERLSHGVLIFTKSNESALRLGRLLILLHPPYSDAIGTLTSTTRSTTRKSTISSFNAGKLSILVASDLVSRGLDLMGLKHVVNYDMPTSVENYVHRVGRTARAGKEGWAWTLVASKEARWFWNEIGRGEGVTRSGKIKRIEIGAGNFGEELKERYEAALEELGREATTSSARQQKKGGK